MNTLNEHITDSAGSLRFEKTLTFTGAPGNPLLAPRGVMLHGNLLVVTDTAQNRVFIWKNFSGEETQEPDVVLGQINQTDTGRNAHSEAGPGTFHYPSGIWTDGKRLIVADAWNHRVLIWHNLPTQNGQPADTVLGQPDGQGHEPNAKGIAAPPDARTLYWPYGVWSMDGQLWIADTGNRRVLYFDKIPTNHFSPATAVIGQENFISKDYETNNAVWPYSVKVHADGRMAISDTQCYRVLLWKDYRKAAAQQADLLLGQPDLQSNGQNQYRLGPASHTLNWCYDACFFEDGIAVADSGNSRIMIWKKWPTVSGEAADEQIGQKDFETNGESSLSMKTTVANQLYWPFALQSHADTLVIADTGNHRILFYKKKKL